LLLERRNSLSTDALLGILSHSALAIGLVVAFLSGIRVDLMGFLFGDILAVSVTDIAVIWIGGAVILGVLIAMWRPLLAATVNAELAEAEGMRPEVTRVIFMLLLASVIAIAMKIVGVLLITALLIIPPATARRVSGTPEVMAAVAAVAGAVAVTGGLFGSLRFDTPSGPSIVVAALILFLVSIALPARLWQRKREA
jgi:zinc transport system permease protein